MQLLMKYYDFQNFSLVNMNNSSRSPQTRDVGFIGPVLKSLSYDDIKPNRLIQTFKAN